MRDQANLNRELRRFVVLPFPRFVLKRKQNPLPLSFPFHPQGREHSFLTTNGKVLANVNAFAVLFVSDSFSLARNEKQVSKLETRVTTSASVFFFLSFLSYVTAVFAKLRATAEDPHCGTYASGSTSFRIISSCFPLCAFVNTRRCQIRSRSYIIENVRYSESHQGVPFSFVSCILKRKP